MTAETMLFWGLSAVAIFAALVVVVARDMVRMIAGLGVFLLAVAAFFLFYRMPFLAAAQVFVYVGGVLVMMIFAVMAIRRDAGGRPRLDARYDLAAFVVSGGVFVVMWVTLGSWEPAGNALGSGGADALGAKLLGPMLPHFEVAGVLLLAALVAVVAILGGRREL